MFIEPLLAGIPLETSLAERTGFYFGTGIAVVVIICGVAKCIQIMRRPTTSALCVTSLLLLLIAWLTSSITNAVVSAHDAPDLVRILGGALATLIALSSFITGVLGLALYNAERFNQGRKQAIWGIVLSSIMMLSFVSGLVLGFIKKSQAENLSAKAIDGKPIEVSEFNFSITPTGNNWLTMKPKALNSAACLSFQRRIPEMYCTVIAENLGNTEQINNDIVTKLAKEKLETASTVLNQVVETKSINGQVFTHLITLAKLDSNEMELQYEHWITTHNGFSYQLLYWGHPANKALISSEALRMTESFRLLDPNRVAVIKGNLKDVSKPEWGYATHLEGKGWNQWKDKASRPSRADFAVSKGNLGLVVVPWRSEDEGPDMRALSRGLLSVLSFEYSKKGDYETSPINVSRGEAVEISTEREIDGKPFIYVMRIYKDKGAALMAATWTRKSPSAQLSDLRELLNGVELLPEVKGVAPALASDEARKQQEEVLNEAGLSYVERNDWEVSAKYFKEAFEVTRSNPMMLNNLAYVQGRAGKAKDALEYIQPYIDRFATDPGFAEHLATLKTKSGDPEGGQIVFLSLVQRGLKDENVLLEWLQLQTKEKQQPLALAAVEAYLKSKPTSSKARLWKAQVLSNGGDLKGSLEVLEKLVADEPKNEDAGNEYGEILNESGDHEKASIVAEKLIKDGFDSIRARMVLGWSQMGKKWYREAKLTFEEAAKKDPDDKSIKRAITDASASLGQGDNSDIKQPIELVKLPIDLEKEIAAAKISEDFGKNSSAYYLLRATGYHYKKGEALRTTLYRRIKVLNTEGVNQYSTLEFPFDSVGERIHVNRLEVKDADGKVIAKSNLDDAYVLDRNKDGTASYQKVLHVQVPSLKPGYIIEAEITREDLSKADSFPYQRYYFWHSLPVACDAIFIEGDSETVKAQLAQAADVIAKKGDHQASWFITRPPQVIDEPMMLPYDRISPMISLSSVEKDWKQVGLDYLNKIKDRLEVDESTTELAKKLVVGITDPKLKIAAIARHVQKELTYKAIEFGIRARRPNRASDTLRQRFGDCKDHALALYQLLNAAGVESQLTLVNTYADIERTQPSLDQFNHMIVRVPSLEANGWLDATNKDADITMLPPESLWERDGLVLDLKEPKLLRLPTIPEGSAKVETQRDISLVGQQDLRVEETVTLHGYYGSWMRGNFAADEPSQRLQHMQRIIGEHLSAQVEEFKFDGLDNPSLPAQLKSIYIVRNAVGTNNGLHGVALPAAWENEYLMISFMKNRQTPFRFRMPFELFSKVTLRLPTKPEASSLSALSKDSNSEFSDWNMKARVSTAKETPNEVVTHFHFRAKPREHSAEKYVKFQQDWEAAKRSWEPKLTWSENP